MRSDKTHAAPAADDLLTVAALGVLAFIASDLAHEVVGHGTGLLGAGGHGGVLTTTKLIADQQLPSPLWRIFDLAGPIGNLCWAALCLVLLGMLRKPSWRSRLFLWSSAMFSLFWESGYLIKTGWSGEGDSMALIPGLQPMIVWRIALSLAGLILYRCALGFLAAKFPFVGTTGVSEARSRTSRLCWTIYLAGGVAACAGAILDPRGPGEVFYSGAMSSFVASMGVAFIPGLVRSSANETVSPSVLVERSLPLVIGATIALLGFVFVLGRGIPVTFQF